MISPLEFLKLVVARWEGGYQSYADDAGNWVALRDGTRRKVGTMRGVTPAALAAYRGVEASTLTEADMKAVTLDVAADIGRSHYYRQPGLGLLDWGPATAAILDFGWGAGPHQAVLSTQRLIGVAADGAIGPVTVKAYDAWIAAKGWPAATEAVRFMRSDFYRHICEINPANHRFLQGWLNRADWASAANDDWRKLWAA